MVKLIVITLSVLAIIGLVLLLMGNITPIQFCMIAIVYAGVMSFFDKGE